MEDANIPTKFNMTKDIGGYNGFGVDICVDTFSGKLTQDVVDSVNVPGDYEFYIAVFTYSPGIDVFVNGVGTASAPGGSTVASQSVLLPSALRVKGSIAATGTSAAVTSTLSYMTPDASGGYITVRFFVSPPWTN